MIARTLGRILALCSKMGLISKPKLWDLQYKLGLWDYLDKSRAQDIVSYLGNVLNQNSRVVEFGCGLGTLSRQFRNSYESWAGFDISSEAIEVANRLKTEKDCFQQQDIREWDEANYLSSDVIVLEEVIYYLSMQEVAVLLDKCNRAVSGSNGRVVITIHDKAKYPELISSILTEHGYRLVSNHRDRVLLEFAGV
jgi:2-polyprenyl-3-methyl-5-hydroxy-6-metoxy-1,4-benzoquinol methylase